MSGLRFERHAPPAPSDPNRADVACFVGLVARRPGDLPPSVRSWLAERGWLDSPYARPGALDLLDVPVPVASWEAFDRLFAWERRDLDGQGRLGGTYLGAAVRSFFAQGGRRCYVVRGGDPLRYHAPWAGVGGRLAALAGLIPGFVGADPLAAGRRETWSGIGHLFGLPDASFLCLPDLADLVKAVPPPPELAIETAVPPERFVECSGGEDAPPADDWARLYAAPRCDDAAYEAWEKAVRLAGRLVARQRREVQLIAAFPLPVRGSDAEADPLRFLYENHWLTAPDGEPLGLKGLSSAFVQLAYPWVRTPGSETLPEKLESPDGALAGLLARNALARGTFRSAAGLPAGDVRDVYPHLRRGQTDREWVGAKGPEGVSLRDRVSLFGPTPSGMRLLSDVTTSVDPSYRPACVGRLVASLVRTARRLGEDSAFESSGEALWARIRHRLGGLLTAYWQAGALRGTTAEEAFQVRCDRSTMSQQDLDQGRVVAEVRFDAAVPIETITVSLVLGDGAGITVSAGAEGVPA
jgi:hypothetical protein